MRSVDGPEQQPYCFCLFLKNVSILYCFWQSSQSLFRWDHNSLPGHIPPELSEEMPFRWTFQSQPIEHGWLTVRRPQEVGYKYTTRPHLKGNCKSGARRQSWKSSTDGSRNSAPCVFFFSRITKHVSLSCIFFETDADIFCFSANAPVNSNHPGWIFQAWAAALLDYFCIGVIMRNDLRADCMRWHWGSYDISNTEPASNTSVKCSFLQPRNLIGAFSLHW